QRALLTVEELRVRPRAHVVTKLVLLLLVHLLPDLRAEDRDVVVGAVVGRARVDVDRPVQAGVRVPLLLLALLVQGEESVPGLVVLPVEDRGGVAADVPLRLLDGERVETRAHAETSSWACAISVMSRAMLDAMSSGSRSVGVIMYEMSARVVPSMSVRRRSVSAPGIRSVSSSTIVSRARTIAGSARVVT